MTIDFLRRLVVFIVLLLAQVLVFNRIQLFHCATPLLYVYFSIIFPLGYPRWAAMLWSFAMGLAIDMFSNTPGLAAASMTLIGLLQPYLLALFAPHEPDDNVKASVSALGLGKFATLAGVLVLVYCLVFFTLEAFSFSDWLYWLQCMGGSALLTILLILALESLRNK